MNDRRIGTLYQPGHERAARVIRTLAIIATVVLILRDTLATQERNPTTASSRNGGPPPRSTLGPRDAKTRAELLKEFGGDLQTERAVADGLAWLAAHQRKDGVWDRKAFDRNCPGDDRCSQTSMLRSSDGLDVGVSALAALAFLGAGHTHEAGPFKDNLTRVFEFILAQQAPDGSFDRGGGQQVYNDAVATLAIAEALALTRDEVFRRPLQRAVRHLESCQQPCGGWDYTGNIQSGRCDTSITGWVIMAFKAADGAGMSASLDTRLRALEHFDRATENDGRVWYANKGTGIDVNPGTGIKSRRYGPAMTAVGLYARTAFGLRVDDAEARRQTELLLSDPPRVARMYSDRANLHGEYYWYYGTLAMFNIGGEDWKRWNQALRQAILEYQERPTRKDGSKRHTYGSWPAYGKDWGKWGRSGSRIYSTAINTLTLEIYYRYTPAYLSPFGLLGPDEMRRLFVERPPNEHPRLLRLARRLNADTAEPILLDLLTHENPALRLDAALALADIGNPGAAAELARQRASADSDLLKRIDARLAGLQKSATPPDIGVVTRYDAPSGMFLFDTGDARVYYAQEIVVIREGREIAEATINRRFSGQHAAAATIRRAPGEPPPDVKVGDLVRTRGDGNAQPPTTASGP